MSISIQNRLPVPGSLGASVSSGISFDLITSEGSTVDQSSLEIEIDSVVAYTESAFTDGFSGTVISDGHGGWGIVVTPDEDFSFNADVDISIACVELPSITPFTQEYSFHTIRNIELSVNAQYIEDGDVIDLGIYVHEEQEDVTTIVNTVEVYVYDSSHVGETAPTLFESFTFNNERNLFASDGAFIVRFLHPPSAKLSMTYRVVATIDQYQAPNIVSVTATGDIVYMAKPTARVLSGGEQPYPQGEINKPRVEYDGRYNQSFQINEVDYQRVDLAGNNTLPDLLVDVNLLAGDAYAAFLNGDVSYSGGGNRLLRGIDDSNTFVLQDSNGFPPRIDGRTLAEPTNTNLLPNSLLLEENPFTVYGTDSNVITEADLKSLILAEDNSTALANIGYFVFEGLTSYDGTTRHACAKSPVIAYISGRDVIASTLIRLQYRNATVTLQNFNFRVVFYNDANAQVYTSATAYDPADFISSTTYSLAEKSVASGSIPGTATKMAFILDFDSFESCDRIEVFMVGPCIEYGTYSTSRTVASTLTATRRADVLSIAQAKNINIESGTIVLDIVPTYDGFPPVTATLLDSRLPGSLINGFYAVHKSDGVVDFSVVDSFGNTTTVSSSPLNIPIGEETALHFLWDADTLKIKNGSTTIATREGSYTQPNGINTSIYIGCDADGNSPALSEICRFMVYSRMMDNEA